VQATKNNRKGIGEEEKQRKTGIKNKNRKKDSKKRFKNGCKHIWAEKRKKIPQKMAENLFKYSDKRGETG